MLKTSKPVEELAKDRKFVCLADTWSSKWDICSYIEEELHDIFHISYSMKFAIDKMMECYAEYKLADEEIKKLGYTINDVFEVKKYMEEKEGGITE